MTLINKFTYQLTTTGPILNDDSTPNAPFVDIDKVSGLDNAPYRITKRDHEGVDGGFMDAEFETGRDIILEGTAYVPIGQSIENYMDTLKASFAPSRTLVPFYIYSDTSVRLMFVKPLGLQYSWDSMARTGCVAVKFSLYAEQPFFFDSNTTSTTLPVGATIFTGFAFNLGFNFGFGGTSTTTDGQFVTNNGNRPTPVTFTITGPVTNPVIYNDTLSTNMAFNCTLANTDSLVIDTYYKTVFLNGGNRRNFLTNAGWFYLAPGQNFIRFRATAGTGTLAVAFRNAWR